MSSTAHTPFGQPVDTPELAASQGVETLAAALHRHRQFIKGMYETAMGQALASTMATATVAPEAWGYPLAVAATAPARPPLIRLPPHVESSGAASLEHRLSLGEDAYLIDHCIDGKPVLPMAAALEYMAQFVAASWPRWQLAEMRDVRMLSGVVLDGYTPCDLVLRARPSVRDDPEQQVVTVEIFDPKRKCIRYRATAVLMTQLPKAPPPRIETLPDAVAIVAGRTYGEFLFHGERFHLIRQISGLAAGGVDAEVVTSSPQGFLGDSDQNARWIFDPGLMDVPPQLAFVWARVQRDMGALPSRFGKVVRYGTAPLSGPLSLTMRLKPAPHESVLVYDAQIVDAAGMLRILVVDGESTMSAALNRLAPNHGKFVRGLAA